MGANGVDDSFDRYARLLRSALGVPVALVSLVEEHRQWFPGASGLAEPWATCRETPLTHSFCQHVVADREPLVVRDAREDERLRDNLAIEDLGVVAYAGFPVTDHRDEVIGSLCAIDSEPREWSPRELTVIEELAGICSTELAQRGLQQLATQRQRRAQHLSRQSRTLLSLSEALADTQTVEDVADALTKVTLDHLGCQFAGIWLRDAQWTRQREQPDEPDGGVPEELHHVSSLLTSWPAVHHVDRLPLDRSNPLGAALLDQVPAFLADRQEQRQRYPDLSEAGRVGEAQAYVPLLARGRAYGTLLLVWEDAGEVPEEVRLTVATLAAYTAQALQRALLFQDRMDALVTLQSSLMPQLPEPPGITLAARYLPAATLDQVGGDWYDAVVMPDGEVAVMIGDVIGHDLAAAATMGQVRNMLRAFALAVDEAPSGNVARLDRAMADLGVPAMATMVYARLTPREAGMHRLRWANAGHPPPLLLTPGGEVLQLGTTECDAMLGVLPDCERTDQQIAVLPGSTLLLYTDGLVERRGHSLDDSIASLCRSLHEHRSLGPEDLCDAILADAGAGQLEDDVALLAVQIEKD